MRVAIVHYWFVSRRGGERVVEALCELFPQGTDYAQLPHSVLMQPLFSAKCMATAMLFVACVWFLLVSDEGTIRHDW